MKINKQIKNHLKKQNKKESNKFLGTLKANRIKPTEMKEKVRKLQENKLCSRNFIKGLNTLTFFLVRCFESFFNWTRKELRNMELRMRKLMTTHKALHTGNDIDRLYIIKNVGSTRKY